MSKNNSTLRKRLIPSGSRREKITQTLQAILLMLQQYGKQAIVNPKGSFSSSKTIIRQFSLRQSLRDMQSMWQRGRSGVSYLQMNYHYQEWIAKNEPDNKQLDQQRQQEANFAYRPLISFLTPVYNPGISVLRDTLNSVQSQTYTNWEFCLANGSTDPEVGQLLDEFTQKDQRFRVIHLAENLGISGNTNQVLHIAQGEFAALLDHDDLVSPDMLFDVVSALNQNQNHDVIYFDEDKISEDGQNRNAPWFKPTEFSPDLLLSTNYLMHSVIRRQIIIDIGGFDSTVDGAQDWDLALRLVEHTKNIHHIPRVYYHWRQVIGSAARDANAKPWAYTAQERCIKAHLQRHGYENIQVEFPRLGTVHILWPTQQAKVSIIIPTKNKKELLQACLDSIIEKTTYPNYEILVVDNQSDDPATFQYYQSLSNLPQIRILEYPHPYNFQTINNWAARQSNGDVLIFLNNDTEVIEPTWIEDLAGWAMRPETGVVGTKLLRPNGQVQHAGLVIGLVGHGSHVFEDCNDHVYTHFGSVDWYRNYHAVTGACMAVRRSVFEELGGLDEAYIIGFGDIDFCLRAEELGYRNVYTPFAPMLHHEGGTRGLSLPPSDVLRASVKMYSIVQKGDGFFNPNLSYSSRQPVVSAINEEDRGERLVRIMKLFDLISAEVRTAKWNKNLSTLSPSLLAPKTNNIDRESKQMSSILIVTHEMTRSGAPIILWMLAEYLKEQGYSVKVISPVDGALMEDYLASGIPATVVSGLLKDSRAVIPYLDDTDVVLCNTILTWRVVHAAKAFSTPCLWWVHETEFGAGLAAKQTAIAQAFSAATWVIFPTQTTANHYLQYLNLNAYSYIHYGLDVNISTTSNNTFIEKQSDELHMIWVATIEKRKGQDVLLKAMDALPQDIASKVHCHLIGRTRLEPIYYLKIAWRARWMNNVHLVGELPNDQVLAYLQQSDVFILASRDEALPISLIEAMAYGKPIVTTNAGGIAEAINNGKNGFVVDVEDSKAMAAYISRLYYEPDLRLSLGEQARIDYETLHTMSHFGEQMAGLLQKIYENDPPIDL